MAPSSLTCLSFWIWAGLWLLWPTDYRGNDVMWLSRQGPKRHTPSICSVGKLAACMLPLRTQPLAAAAAAAVQWEPWVACKFLANTPKEAFWSTWPETLTCRWRDLQMAPASEGCHPSHPSPLRCSSRQGTETNIPEMPFLFLICRKSKHNEIVDI